MTEVLTSPLVAEHCGMCRDEIGARERGSADYEQFCENCTDLPDRWSANDRRRLLAGAGAPDPENVDRSDDEDDEDPVGWSCSYCDSEEAVLRRSGSVDSCYDCTRDNDTLTFHLDDIDYDVTVECAGCGRTVRESWNET